MSKLTIEIEADDVVDGKVRAPVITLSYNGKKLSLLQRVEFQAAVADPIPILRLYGVDRRSPQLPALSENMADLRELGSAWPWAEVILHEIKSFEENKP